MRRRFLLVGLAVIQAGCSADTTSPMADDRAAFSVGSSGPGAIYIMTNAAAGNAVLAFGRSADGTLNSPSMHATGGLGSGAGLGSQGALVLNHDNNWLLAVDAGSDELSVFRVGRNGLVLTDNVASGGDLPISVTIYGSLVYVLNAGGAGNITGFTLSSDGSLSPLAGSTRPLSGPASGPAQVAFSPDGQLLVVTEKNTNRILTYMVGANGLASAPTVHASAGLTPFGFAFAGRTTLLVSEAFGGAANGSATSSYELGAGGTLQVISASVGTTETAACWTVVTKNGRYAYVTNTGSASVTGYAVGSDGSLDILNANGVTGVTGAGPIDADFSVNSRYLYTLNSGNGSISIFVVKSDGSLSALTGNTGLPPSAVGLAAF